MTTAAPGTIPALPPYQPGALQLTGTEAFEIVNTTNPATAASYFMLLTDAIGKVPGVLPVAAPVAGDLFAFTQGATGLPRSCSLAAIAVPSGNVAPGGTAGQLYFKNSGTNFDASWTAVLPNLTLGTLAVNGTVTVSGTAIVDNLAVNTAATVANLAVATGTVTNLAATFATLANLVGTNLNVTIGTVTNLTVTNLTVAVWTAGNLSAANLTATNATIANLSVTNLSTVTATVTTETVTNLTATNLTAANGTVTSLIVANLTVSANATVGGNLTVIGSASLGAPLSVPNGGTNTSTLTQSGIVYGNGSSTIGITAAGGTGNVLLANNGVPFFSPFLKTLGFSVVTTNFGGALSTTTLVNVDGLSASLAATSSYFFRCYLYVTAGSTGGTKLAINASQAINSIIYDGNFSASAGTAVVSFGGGRAVSLASGLTATAATTPTCHIFGTVVTNSSCTLTPQIAQVAATTTTTLVLAGSIFEVFQVA